MTEIFNDLAAVGDAVKSRIVVHLLASLPDSYGMLVTALERVTDCIIFAPAYNQTENAEKTVK